MKARSVLFVVLPYLVWTKGSINNSGRILTFPYGVLSIMSYIRKKLSPEIKINILDLNLYPQEETDLIIDKYLADCNPDIVAISMMFDFSLDYLDSVSRRVKNFDEEALVVLGGGSATVSWNMVLESHIYVDAICYGEGEVPFVELVESDNLWKKLEGDSVWVTRKSLFFNQLPETRFLDNLNEVISIDYDLIDINAYGIKEAFSPFSLSSTSRETRHFPVITSRGCPFRCVFCSAHSLHGKRVRCADVDVLIKHIELLIEKYGMNVLTLYDDQILFRKDRAKELFRRLAKFNLRVEIPTGLSVSFIDEEMAELMRAAGVDTTSLAIESGSSRMLKDVIRKPLRLEKVQPTVEILQRNNFFVYGLFVVGLPGETEDDREETTRFIKEIGLDWSSFSLATPVRGSELYKICVDNGYIDPSFSIGRLGVYDYVIKVPGIDPEEIKRKRYLMNLDVNFVNNHRLKTGEYQIAKACFEDVISRYEDHAFAYYYLAKTLEALFFPPKQICHALLRVDEIIKKDSVWQEYFDFFGINPKVLSKF